MALKDIFKKKKIEKKKIESAVEKKEVKIEKPINKNVKEIKKEKITSNSWRILKSPHITEKSTELTKRNYYVFKILPKANKMEVKKAIEGLYNVDVLDVKIIKIPKKRRKLGRISGWRKGYKKAIVKIKEGQKIEILPR